jgi:PGF-pre-PGF domain-containing protein
MNLKIKIKKIMPKFNKFLVIIIFLVSIKMAYGYGESISGMATTGLEPYGNIINYEVRESNLIPNQLITYSFTSPNLGIYEVLVNGKDIENGIPIRIENLRQTSIHAMKPVPGIIYRNENILIGTKKLNYIGVRFKVENSWMTENNLNDTFYPHLLKWNGVNWLILKTNIIKKDQMYTYFEASKAGDAYVDIFAISAPSKPIGDNSVLFENGKFWENSTGLNASDSGNGTVMADVKGHNSIAFNTTYLPGFLFIAILILFGIIHANKNLRIKRIIKEK